MILPKLLNLIYHCLKFIHSKFHEKILTFSGMSGEWKTHNFCHFFTVSLDLKSFLFCYVWKITAFVLILFFYGLHRPTSVDELISSWAIVSVQWSDASQTVWHRNNFFFISMRNGKDGLMFCVLFLKLPSILWQMNVSHKWQSESGDCIRHDRKAAGQWCWPGWNVLSWGWFCQMFHFTK